MVLKVVVYTVSPGDTEVIDDEWDSRDGNSIIWYNGDTSQEENIPFESWDKNNKMFVTKSAEKAELVRQALAVGRKDGEERMKEQMTNKLVRQVINLLAD